MRKSILINPVLRLSGFVLSLLLLIPLIIGTVNADSDKTGAATDMVIRHMDAMKQKFPEIDGTVFRTETELSNGMMSPRQACSHCHTEEQGKP